ncbi:unnamed protein product [Diabrotica balteata]|uniref:DUF7869 domain-containing protein n=1 Tax=Diabrotica balteata TaxID=107213 RepID=A0A9N9SNZ8_DIABA|nr:unnamed protein product [Diabrotica balteata]
MQNVQTYTGDISDQHMSTPLLVNYPNNLLPASPQTLQEYLIVSDSSSDVYEPSPASDIHSSLESDLESVAFQIETDITPKNLAKKESMKRKRNEKLWKKNVKKVKRLKGESYVGYRGIKVPSRPLLPAPCLNKQKHKCATLISEQNRIKIYNDFNNFTSNNDQRQFVSNHIEQKDKKRTTRGIENSRKNYTYVYSLTVDGIKLTVCREFFMATLNVTDAFMRSAINKRSSNGVLEKDKRGKHQPSNKLPQDVEEFIRNHILSFPAVESHYCRKSSTKKYLDSSLNISIMYRMYKELCSTKKDKTVSFEKYRQIFCEYNLGFFKPKKDQCRKCLTFKNMSEEQKIIEEEAYLQHLKRKMKLEKLAMRTSNQDVMCYLWDETKGKRGSNEISSCVLDFVMSHSQIEAVRMMSDGCGGQQKNAIFATMCIQLLAKHPSLKVIDHKFFETGHTEMECDSIHSKIEKKAKYVPVYTPEGWAQLIRDARITPSPFVVKYLTCDAFLDFKGFLNNSSFKLSEIPWRKLCCLQYIKENNVIKVLYKVNFTDDFIEVDYKKTRGRPKQAELQKAYQSDLPISEAKLKDLDKMCKDLTIPRGYHDFYGSLKKIKR